MLSRADQAKSAQIQAVRKRGKLQVPKNQLPLLFFFLPESIGYCPACLCAHVSPSRIGKIFISLLGSPTVECRKSDLDRNSRDGSVTKAVPRVNRSLGLAHWSEIQFMDLYSLCRGFRISCSNAPLEFNGHTFPG